MKKRSRKISLSLIVLSLMMVFAQTLPVSAEGISTTLKTSAATIEKGKTVTLTVGINAAVTLENYDTAVQYDPTRFTYVGAKNLASGLSMFGDNQTADNVITLTAGAGSQADTASLCQLTFKAIATGKGSFSTSNTTINQDSASSASASITVIEPLPGTNTLKSLSISPGVLSPAFAQNISSYSVQLPTSVKSVSVSANAVDSEASVAVSGNTNLQDGENTIKITVTAQNGAKKTYTIKAIRSAATPTPAASPTPEATPAPSVTVQLPDGPYTVEDPPVDLPVPGGFYKTLLMIGGQPVSGFKALKGDTVLVFLNNGAGESGLYVYDEAGQTYYPFAVLTIPGQDFTLVTPDETVTVPDGFDTTSLTINGLLISCWKPAEEVSVDDPLYETYLIYLMNQEGQKGFYFYQLTGQMIYPYLALSAMPTIPAETTATATPTPVPQPILPQNNDSWMIATLIFGCLSLLLLGLLTWTYVRYVHVADGSRSQHPKHPKPPTIRRVD